MKLEKEYPDYYSKYSMVTFHENMSYADAMKKGRRQDELLLALCRDGRTNDMSIEKHQRTTWQNMSKIRVAILGLRKSRAISDSGDH